MSASRAPTLTARHPGHADVAPSPGDVDYCRRVLPRVSRTFALNIRLLSGSMGDAVRVAYLLCRIADTLEDDWGGTRDEIERRFDTMLAIVAGDGEAAESLAAAAASMPVAEGGADAEHRALVAHTPRVWRCFMGLHPADREAVAEAVSVLARGMRRYATGAPGIADEPELRDYCWIVAGCVGVMLTRLAARRAPAAPAVEARRLALAPTVGEGLQLTNILLDWPADVRRGRRYVPATWIAEEGGSAARLVGAPDPAVARLADRLERLARAALAVVPDYLATWPIRMTRYRMFCLWPSLWALASIEHARRDPEFPWGPRRPRLPKDVLWRAAMAAVVHGHRDAGVRRLFAAHARAPEGDQMRMGGRIPGASKMP